MSTVAMLLSWPGVPELYVVASVDEHSSRYHGLNLPTDNRITTLTTITSDTNDNMRTSEIREREIWVPEGWNGWEARGM